jgi:hypothetical protein
MAFGKSALILVAALLPLAPLAMTEEAPPQGGLKTPADWTWRLDEPAQMSPDGKSIEGKWWFVAMPPGWHITMGPGGVVYHPDYTAKGRFVVESEIFLFPDSTDEGVGIFVGGESLGERDEPTYTALLLRKDGMASVARRERGASASLSAWTAVEGVKPHGGKDAEKHAFRIEVDTKTVAFSVDGAKVASLDRAQVAPDGRFGFRIGRGVNIHVVRLDFTQQLAPPRASKSGM